MLTNNEQLRYSRQLLLKEFSDLDQMKLKNATVLIVGIGGLGNPVSLYLASAGVGRLILADGDKIELSNLQRQVSFTQAQIGDNKAETIAEHLQQLNEEIDIEVVDEMLNLEQLSYYSDEVDVIVDCTDNLASRLMINQACVTSKTPLISGAAIRMEGQIFCIDPRQPNYACYECFYPQRKIEPTLNCNTAGILGPVLGIIGSMQALETIKLLIEKPIPLNQIKLFDGLTSSWQQFNVKKRAGCICN